MPNIHDGPSSSQFIPVPFKGNATFATLLAAGSDSMPFGLSREMIAALEQAPSGAAVAWGIPFEIGEVVVVSQQPVSVDVAPTRARWLVFLHTSDVRPLQPGPGGIISPMRGRGQLAEHAADYVVCYADGSEARTAIRRRHQLGAFQRSWGENCFESVAHHKPFPLRAGDEQMQPAWGESQTRVVAADDGSWVNWLWAWENPNPDKVIATLRFEPVSGVIIISAISAGHVASHPLRWRTRRKARLALPDGEAFAPELDQDGQLKQVALDLGQVISAAPRPVYPNSAWPETHNNQLPELSANEVLIEYTSHPEACFNLTGTSGSRAVPVAEVEEMPSNLPIQAVAAAEHLVRLRVVERGSRQPVPVKLHLHGESGEYLAPVDRQRLVNRGFFEDYGADFAHLAEWSGNAPTHTCTYIRGETLVRLPTGKVYVEVAKGFEIRPVRRVVDVTPQTAEIEIEIERALPWREKGWVTADTHVHFLSPLTAWLEGSAEGVNVINLLASQWGELMTNAGDFDGENTWGSKETGGSGEYLVRVGTENRQHVMGHISLLGYQGPMIAPMTSGGPDESALGDAVEVLLTEWARQCREQGGVVVLPHFPNPRAEHAAAIVSGQIDALEMTSWEDLYSGINPYSVSDWYRYLNCGYLVPAVGGTDKMTAATAVGTVRTYAQLGPEREFTYETWKNAIRRGETFVTYGPLLDFQVDGRRMGSRIRMSGGGGTVNVTWQAASVTIPISRAELVVNGEVRESQVIQADAASGHWTIKLDKTAWLALLVRGHYADKPEIIVAHSTPVMVEVDGKPPLAAADAVSILDQIEGAMVYLDTVGTRAEDRVYKRMRLTLEAAHRSLHNRLHQAGMYHLHALGDEQAAHR